jgi:hypothetical protein
MIWKEALLALEQGMKVKLPEWTGYWFIDESASNNNILDRIRVFTRTGDTLATPFFHLYVDRTDWEITKGNLGFDFAIVALKAGKMVRRAGWDPGVYAWIVGGMRLERKRFLDKEILPHISLVTSNNKIINGFCATQIDMLAEDWELYTESSISPTDVLGLHSS